MTKKDRNRKATREGDGGSEPPGKALGLDFLTNPINVQWGEGLAVEFFEGAT